MSDGFWGGGGRTANNLLSGVRSSSDHIELFYLFDHGSVKVKCYLSLRKSPSFHYTTANIFSYNNQV